MRHVPSEPKGGTAPVVTSFVLNWTAIEAATVAGEPWAGTAVGDHEITVSTSTSLVLSYASLPKAPSGADGAVWLANYVDFQLFMGNGNTFDQETVLDAKIDVESKTITFDITDYALSEGTKHTLTIKAVVKDGENILNSTKGAKVTAQFV